MKKENIEQILQPTNQALVVQNEETVRDQFWSKFRQFASKIPFSNDLAAAYFCAIDKETPLKVRGTLFAALAYFIVPIDVIPDILALVGFSDDIAVLSVAFAMVQNHVKKEHHLQAEKFLKPDGTPSSS